MNLSIVGKQLELTDSIKGHIQGAVDTLKKYNLDIISTKCILSADEKNGKKGFSVEFAINLAHMNTVVIKQKDKDVYAAIDLAIDRAQKVLRRHHDKVTSFKQKEVPEVETEEVEYSEDEIVPMRLESYKPIDVDDALAELKENGQQFMIFHDKEDKVRVLYKRSDAKFGLY
ncbi:ribosome hibernation-promoting factor, HPF/YfiA family [Sulfurospirillum sp. 1612]|uniref:ribosome hibernation-promoting factor, HPF/YfiA family n=1 Tax=Sulfurospirillum sp. 1612 TaxID=3094835 RepID=UPI002F93F2A0